MSTILAILQAITSANLPAATERVAARLLALAGDAGQVNLAWDAYLDLAAVANVNAARRHLTRLRTAHLIHYSTNDNVYITFLAALGDAANCAPTRPPERVGAPPTARNVPNPVTYAPSPARRRAAHGAWARNYPPHPYSNKHLYVPDAYRDLIVGAQTLSTQPNQQELGDPT